MTEERVFIRHQVMVVENRPPERATRPEERGRKPGTWYRCQWAAIHQWVAIHSDMVRFN
jgi:hypothetical protein